MIGVTSLESLAYNLFDALQASSIVCSLIDAKNNNVYCGIYKKDSKQYNLISIFTDSIDNTLEKIKNTISSMKVANISFVGDASYMYKKKIVSVFPDANFASEEQNLQNGISVGRAGYAKYLSGEYGNSSSISPIYLRKSQAERALEEKIQILPMTMEDIDSISPDFEGNFDKFWNINNLKNDFQNPNATYFIAKLDDEIVGFAGILKICDEANIMNIVTRSNKRHLGVGERLLKELISSAKKQNLKSITLEVNVNNYPAIHLYEKFNFKRIGLRKKYYNNTDYALIMTLEI